MPLPRSSSVGFRLISLASWILLPVIVAIGYLIWQFSEDRIRAQRELMVGNTRALAAAVDAEVNRHIVAATTLAAARARSNLSLEDFYKFSKSALDHLPNSWVVLVDADGRQLINTLVPSGAELPALSNPDLLQKAVNASDAYVTDVVMARVVKKYVAGVIVPVVTSRPTKEFIIVAINTDRMGEIMRENRLPDGWLNGVIDRNGNFIARNVDHAKLIGRPGSQGWRTAAKQRQEGFFETISIEGNPLNTYFVNSPLTGWSVAVGAEQDVLWAPVERSIWQMAAFVSALIALSVILALWVGRRITVPMKSLEHSAIALIHGERLSLAHTGIREVDHAFDAFEISATELLERDRRQNILVGELGHRIKNILAIIQATARLSSQSVGTLDDYLKNFESRLMGISRTHDLLLRGSWKGASLNDILLGELSVYATDLKERVITNGPPVELPPSLTWSMSLIAHELATNAAKYGALSVPSGRVEVSWDVKPVEAGKRVTLRWRETGGPAVKTPTRTGFGSKLVKRIVEGELSGSAQFDYAAEGFCCELQFLIAANVVPGEPGQQPAILDDSKD